jgi:hypothetical protein
MARGGRARRRFRRFGRKVKKTAKAVGKFIKKAIKKVNDIANSVKHWAEKHIPGLNILIDLAEVAFPVVGQIRGAFDKIKMMKQLIINGKIPALSSFAGLIPALDKVIDITEKAKKVKAAYKATKKVAKGDLQGVMDGMKLISSTQLEGLSEHLGNPRVAEAIKKGIEVKDTVDQWKANYDDLRESANNVKQLKDKIKGEVKKERDRVIKEVIPGVKLDQVKNKLDAKQAQLNKKQEIIMDTFTPDIDSLAQKINALREANQKRRSAIYSRKRR